MLAVASLKSAPPSSSGHARPKRSRNSSASSLRSLLPDRSQRPAHSLGWIRNEHFSGVEPSKSYIGVPTHQRAVLVEVHRIALVHCWRQVRHESVRQKVDLSCRARDASSWTIR